MIVHQITNSIGNHNYNAFIYNNIIYSAHFHGNYELIYAIDASSEITVNGDCVTLEPGSLMLISPYATHSLKILGNAKAWIGVFSKDFVSDFANKYPFKNFSKFKCSKQIEDFLKINLFKAYTPEHYLLTGCLYLVCGQCVESNPIYTHDDNIDFVKSVMLYITENLANNITMKETAYKLNYEYHYFSALFNKYFSVNFRKFINMLRFEQACKMLSEEKSSIVEICSDCGFESIRNFNRIFKEFSGITPSEYKNRQPQINDCLTL